MPSPIAHSVSGYVLAKLLPWEVFSGERLNLGYLETFYGVFVAIAADFDFIPQLITGVRFHRGFSHSLFFALAFSIIIAWLWSYFRHSNYLKTWLFTFFIYSSHLLLDFFTKGGSGMQLFWPFSDNLYQASVSIFPQVHHSRGLFDPSHWVFISFELVYTIILLGIIWIWQSFKNKRIKT